jgi:DNA repair photolyase
MQMSLFDEQTNQPDKIGKARVGYKEASSILSKASGFMDSYDYTLNPYSGCTFGCTYCYAAFFTRDKDKMDNWGYWVDVKENAMQLLVKYRKKPLGNATIYMSSVTDPYQPIDKQLELTREVLKELIQFHPDVRLVIQTRAPLVTRDIDLFQKFKHIQINMTITTDSEEVRKAFEPLCPSNKVRLNAIKEINDARVNSCITMTPLLPVDDAEKFAQDLLSTGIKNFIIQPFHSTKGKFVAGTRQAAFDIIEKYNWSNQRYIDVLKVFQQHIPEIGIGKSGFAPL